MYSARPISTHQSVNFQLKKKGREKREKMGVGKGQNRVYRSLNKIKVKKKNLGSD